MLWYAILSFASAVIAVLISMHDGDLLKQDQKLLLQQRLKALNCELTRESGEGLFSLDQCTISSLPGDTPNEEAKPEGKEEALSP
jgi:hypothetical protein